MARKCPDCNRALPPGSSVRFDQHHNIYCGLCGAVVLAAEETKERKEKKPEPTTNHWQRQQRGYHYDPDEEFAYRNMSD